jgi:hypothetical protein
LSEGQPPVGLAFAGQFYLRAQLNGKTKRAIAIDEPVIAVQVETIEHGEGCGAYVALSTVTASATSRPFCSTMSASAEKAVVRHAQSGIFAGIKAVDYRRYDTMRGCRPQSAPCRSCTVWLARRAGR